MGRGRLQAQARRLQGHAGGLQEGARDGRLERQGALPPGAGVRGHQGLRRGRRGPQAGVEIEPQNKDVRGEYKRVRAAQAKQDKKEAGMYASMFKKMAAQSDGGGGGGDAKAENGNGAAEKKDCEKGCCGVETKACETGCC